VDTLWTLTSLLEYYTTTFIDAIMKLFTHTLNQGLTDITSLLFITVVTILRSVKHGHQTNMLRYVIFMFSELHPPPKGMNFS